MSTKVINISSITLKEDEIRLLMLGMSFTPTPTSDMHDLERDLYELSRKLRLTYHFRNSKYIDSSIIKLKSDFCPKRNEDHELETICSKLERLNISTRNIRDNIRNERAGLSSLIERVNSGEIVIKPADKRSIVVIMDSNYYYDMCIRHLHDTNYYKQVDKDPSVIIHTKVIEFANNYQKMLTKQEYNYLVSSKYELSNIYMLPKLHKSRRIDEIITFRQEEYIHITDEEIILEGRPICSGPSYYTRGISLMIHQILFPCIGLIDHIAKDTFDFKNRIEKNCTEEDTVLCTWDIKALYNNIRHELFLESVEYWARKFQHHLPLMKRFSLSFILEGLRIILLYNYVKFDKKILLQTKGVAMGAPAAVVGSNLVVAYLEVQIFARLPDIFPLDFVDFFIRNYFRFLDDLFHKWLSYSNIEQFGTI